jgi:hypothetical protein
MNDMKMTDLASMIKSQLTMLSSIETRVSRIETRLCYLMDAAGLEPSTGKPKISWTELNVYKPSK